MTGDNGIHKTTITYAGGGDNPGDTEQTNVDPAMPGPRVMGQVKSLASGASLADGFGEQMGIHDVAPSDIGADTIGGGQIHMQHPKTPAGRGTRFG